MNHPTMMLLIAHLIERLAVVEEGMRLLLTEREVAVLGRLTKGLRSPLTDDDKQG